MRVEELASLHQRLESDGVIFFYEGFLNEKVLSGLGNAVRSKLDGEHEDVRVARAVFSVLVEEVHNIIQHSAKYVRTHDGEDDPELRKGSVAIGKQDGHYFVASGNPVRQEEVEGLRRTLSSIQAMGRDDLKGLYRRTLHQKDAIEDQVLGLGFIEIARRAVRGFEFDFRDLDREHAYFIL